MALRGCEKAEGKLWLVSATYLLDYELGRGEAIALGCREGDVPLWM
jgi:hypothetical protein